ncbi:disease resistance protein RPV1-like isoform X2 [Eucalyptus grandis]|uniref:disease resistance protein RPV1-like isoform X2 n=1 Tax=Eucalyptus grandis TaxID=71139 RepID=UPI00192EF6A4|nr:disease resistance protein RPV1-like isoform X2 [Eucalyptus grandis]
MKSLDINNVMEGKEVIKRRLFSKRVLLLLDDVNDASQLDALMQKREWFGKGSKIIITTQDQGILKVPTLVDGAYELNGMNFNHSLELFSKHAFRRDNPIKQYNSHSIRAAKICGGLPLALEVIGSLLSGKSIEEWDAILKELEKFPQEDVEKKLIISIEALNESQKNIFLDVACFFIGCDRRIVIHMWEGCDFCPHQSLSILQQRSLIKIRDDNQLWMHDWLRDIGRNFIRRESDMKPEKQQWVWTYEQALDVLEKTQNGGGFHGNENIRAICLEFDEQSRYPFIKEFLASLSNLGYLRVDKKSMSQVDSKDFNGDSMSILTQADPFQYNHNSNFLQTTSSRCILSELRWLSWNYFPMDYKLTFYLRKLVILDLLKSNITEEWDGWSHIKARNLKVLNLTGCQELRETPDLSFNVNLVQLILEGCRSLVRIHPSISHLKRLVILNLKDCYHLHMLPDEIGELESLEQLLLDSTSIEEIPEWRKAKKLKILSLVECKSLKKFNFVGCATSSVGVDIIFTQQPKSIENCNSLTKLDLTRSAIQELPDSIGNLKSLRVLKMIDSSIRKLPSAIGMLEKLEELEAGAFAITTLRGEIPDNIGKLRYLKRLWISICGISAAPQLPESLIDLSFISTSIKTLPLLNLLNLRKLTVYSPRITTLSPDISFLSQLEELTLRCMNLQCLPRLPTNLSILLMGESNKWKTTNDLSYLKSLWKLLVRDCRRLTEIQGLEGLQNLRELELHGLPSLAKLPHLTNLRELEAIRLEDCPQLFKFRCSLDSVECIVNNLGLKMLLATSRSKPLHIQFQQKEFDPITLCPRCNPSTLFCTRHGLLYP